MPRPLRSFRDGALAPGPGIHSHNRLNIARSEFHLVLPWLWIPGLTASRCPGMTGASQRSAARFSLRAPDALRLFPSPEKMRGAERRQALVRNAAPRDPPRDRVHLRIAGDDRPMTRAGAPLDALLRRSPYGIGPRFQALMRRRQPAPGRGSLCPRAEPRRRPGAGCEPARGRRSNRGPELPGAGCRILGPALRSRLRPAPP